MISCAAFFPICMAVCNHQYMDEARKVSRCSKSDLKKVKLWVSCGKKDKIASLKSSKAVAKQLDSYYGEMKVEEFAGAHMINKPSLTNALAWFLTETE
jgi:predicted esterase